LQRLPLRSPSSSHHVRNPLLPATSTTCFFSVRFLSSIYSCIKIMSLFLMNMLVRNACLYLCEFLLSSCLVVDLYTSQVICRAHIGVDLI
jgi:hypothetical protein